MDAAEVGLRGPHNLENAMAAAAATLARGVDAGGGAPRRCATSAASRTGSRRSPRSAASCT